MTTTLTSVETPDRGRAVATASVAALPKLGEGIVEAYVSVYDVEYRMGYATWHKILEGAFDDSITEQASIPIFWAHAWDWSEQTPIGHSLVVDSDATGLKVQAQLYVDESETARSVYRGMVAGALREWSIGYAILEHTVREDRDTARTILDITKGELLEASSVLRGANPSTETLKVAGAPDLADLETLIDRRVAAALAEMPPASPVDEPAPAPTVAAPVVDLANPRHRELVRARLASTPGAPSVSGQPEEGSQ